MLHAIKHHKCMLMSDIQRKKSMLTPDLLTVDLEKRSPIPLPRSAEAFFKENPMMHTVRSDLQAKFRIFGGVGIGEGGGRAFPS